MRVLARGTVLSLNRLDAKILGECMRDFQLGQAVGSDGAGCGRAGGDPDSPRELADRHECGGGPSVHASRTQQMAWPGELGMQFVTSVHEWLLYWGVALNSTNI